MFVGLRGQEECDQNLDGHSNLTLSSKINQTSEEPAHDYDHEKFVNASAAEKFDLISKNRSFKEKGFHHLDDFFRKTIANKGWRELFQPPRPAATSEVRELYTNLAIHVLKKVWVVWFWYTSVRSL